MFTSSQLIEYKSYEYSNSITTNELISTWCNQKIKNVYGRIPEIDGNVYPITIHDLDTILPDGNWNVCFVHSKPENQQAFCLYAQDIHSLQKQILLAYLLSTVTKVIVYYEHDIGKVIDLDQESIVKDTIIDHIKDKKFQTVEQVFEFAKTIGLFKEEYVYLSPQPPVLTAPLLKDTTKTKELVHFLQQSFQDVQIYENVSTYVAYGLMIADQDKQGTKWLLDNGSLSKLDSFLLHSIVSSNQDINVLVLDDGQGFERDVGLYCLNYGNTYTASICPLVSSTQAALAIKEAVEFKGPSVVIFHQPQMTSAKDKVLQLQSAKEMVEKGKTTLYRWNPLTGMTMDSTKPQSTIESFLKKESTLSMIIEPVLDKSVQDLDKLVVNGGGGQDMDKLVLQKSKESYMKLFGSITKKRFLVLYGSDGGNAESLAKRISMEAKEKGLWVTCLPMDSFVAEDLTKEENVLFVVSTAGQGEFPSNARETWKYLISVTKETLDFSKTKVGVFALGDRHYWPREEDKHYFCKAGKDLYARLESLGAQVQGLGIGDDRDADGYYTGYFQYIPTVWEWLGVSVDTIEAVTVSDDAIKAASRFLRGTIAQGLVDESTGALAEMDTKLTKFHGIYQQDDRDVREHRARKGLEKAYSFMIRVRVPGGACTPAQYLAMDDISDRYANGTIKITTRQAFQFHGVLKNVLKKTVQDINKSLLDTIAACGDVNRNVMCNPNPGNSDIHQQVLQTANDISAHLTPSTGAYHEIWLDKKLVAGGEEEPLYGKTYLPRKFKIAIAVPPSNDVDVLAHDLGYIAIVEKGTLIGYNVTVGGGMGQTHGNKKTYPVLAKPLGFVTVEQTVLVGEAVMLVQRDYGDRTNRKHARLKYTIEDRGLDWFREEVEKRIGFKLQSSKPFKFTSNGDRYGWHQQTDGTWSYTMFIQNGRIKDTETYLLKTGLNEIATIHRGEFALTPNQHLMILKIDNEQRPKISQLLRKYNIDNQYSAMRLHSMACVALPTCALAMAESERYLPTLIEKIELILENLGLRDDAITIRMTGCPNGCARPSIAEVAFIGKGTS